MADEVSRRLDELLVRFHADGTAEAHVRYLVTTTIDGDTHVTLTDPKPVSGAADDPLLKALLSDAHGAAIKRADQAEDDRDSAVKTRQAALARHAEVQKLVTDLRTANAALTKRNRQLEDREQGGVNG